MKQNSLSRQLAILERKKQNLIQQTNVQKPTPKEPEDEFEDEIEESDELNLENENPANISELLDDDSDEGNDDIKNENVDEGYDNISNEDTSDENSEDDHNVITEDNSEHSIDELYEKMETLETNFKKFQAKTISLLEAILSANKISIGLSKDEMPRKEVEVKKEGTLHRAIGSFKKEVSAVKLKLTEDQSLKITNLNTIVKRGTACEEELIVNGKVPFGNWIVTENKGDYYLVSVDNFEEAEDVTPYSSETEDTKSSKGIVINKKGTANNVRGYILQAFDDHFKLTDSSLNRPRKVFKAKWNKDCDNSWPVKGNIPEGKWVIVYANEDDEFYLVNSKDVEAKISTLSTQETKKVSKKKVIKKKVSKKK